VYALESKEKVMRFFYRFRADADLMDFLYWKIGMIYRQKDPRSDIAYSFCDGRHSSLYLNLKELKIRRTV